ncbi:MAG: hypothetical protein F6K16_28240 [Symploca sp. SIO2B6]|nr:hypothetical protein [Symploca sp. SIO2B6]
MKPSTGCQPWCGRLSIASIMPLILANLTSTELLHCCRRKAIAEALALRANRIKALSLAQLH